MFHARDQPSGKMKVLVPERIANEALRQAVGYGARLSRDPATGQDAMD
jgi:hypothetical protein